MQENQESRVEKKEIIYWSILITSIIISAIISIVTTFFVTRGSVENSTIEAFGANLVTTLEVGFESVTVNMRYDQAIDHIQIEAETLRNRVAMLERDNALIQNDLTQYSERNEQLRTENISLIDERNSLLQQIANAIDNDSNSLQLQDTQPIVEIESVKLSTIWVIDSGGRYPYRYYPGIHTDSFGSINDGAHHFDGSGGAFAIYNLNSQFTSFSGLIVANQNTGSEASLTIEIRGDGSLLFIKRDFTRRTGAVEFDVDVSGVTQLEVRTSNQGRYPHGHISIVNALLIR